MNPARFASGASPKLSRDYVRHLIRDFRMAVRQIVQMATMVDWRIQVVFQGQQPSTVTDNKGRPTKIVLPEIGMFDQDLSDLELEKLLLLLKQLRAFLWHEIAHVLYTDFEHFAHHLAPKHKALQTVGSPLHYTWNAFEDIVVEALLIRDWPGATVVQWNRRHIYETRIPELAKKYEESGAEPVYNYSFPVMLLQVQSALGDEWRKMPTSWLMGTGTHLYVHTRFADVPERVRGLALIDDKQKRITQCVDLAREVIDTMQADWDTHVASIAASAEYHVNAEIALSESPCEPLYSEVPPSTSKTEEPVTGAPVQPPSNLYRTLGKHPLYAILQPQHWKVSRDTTDDDPALQPN